MSGESEHIKDELKCTAISITCIDRNGDIVKRVTSTDDADIEDPEDDGNDPNGGGSGTSGTNGTSGPGNDSQNPNGQYTISVASNNSAYGTVTGGGTFTSGSRIQLVATPKSGYKFSQWNDGDTNATRQVTVNANKSYTATFVAEAGSGTDQGGEDDGNQSSTPEF